MAHFRSDDPSGESADSDWSDYTFVRRIDYNLDDVSNRTSVAETPYGGPPVNTTYTTNSVNAYTAVGAVSRAHDANGNLLFDGSRFFEFDFKNNLTKVWQGQTRIVTYEYDCFNRRTKKCCDTERFYYDGLDLVEVYNGSNLLLRTIVHGQGIDEPMVLIARDLADFDQDQDEAEFVTLHYHRNMLGSITHLTWDDEEVVESYEYTPYGEPTIRDADGDPLSASAVGNTFLFTAREWDVEVGLYYYRFRTYDPECGRFLQRDPLGYVDEPHLLEYCGSHPTARRDPLGTLWSWICTTVGAAIGAVAGAAEGFVHECLDALQGGDFDGSYIVRATTKGTLLGAAGGMLVGTATGDPSAMLVGGSYAWTFGIAAGLGAAGGAFDSLLDPPVAGPAGGKAGGGGGGGACGMFHAAN